MKRTLLTSFTMSLPKQLTAKLDPEVRKYVMNLCGITHVNGIGLGVIWHLGDELFDKSIGYSVIVNSKRVMDSLKMSKAGETIYVEYETPDEEPPELSKKPIPHKNSDYIDGNETFTIQVYDGFELDGTEVIHQLTNKLKTIYLGTSNLELFKNTETLV